MMEELNDEQLVLQVKERPYLYNQKDLRYKDVGLRNTAWLEIASVLNANGLITPEKCSSRWRTIRDYYFRIRRNTRTRRGVAGKMKIRWPLYDLCSFLNENTFASADMSFENVQTTTGSFDDILFVKSECIESLPDLSNSYLPEEVSNDSALSPQQPADTFIGPESPELLDTVLPTPSRKRRLDDKSWKCDSSADELFFQSITKQVKDMEPSMKTKLKMRIMGLVLDAELGRLE